MRDRIFGHFHLLALLFWDFCCLFRGHVGEGYLKASLRGV